MLKYAAIVPHPPFAIESLGKEKVDQIESTVNAMKEVAEDLRALEIDTVVLISPHGERYKEALGIALHDPYRASLQEFGDMATQDEFMPDIRLIDSLQRGIRAAGYMSTMTTNEMIDYGAAVPMLKFREYIPGVKYVVVTPPAKDAKTLVSLGSVMRDIIDHTTKKVAVLASAELSHRLSEISPGGVHPDSAAFDKKIRSALVDGNSLPILRASEQEIEAVSATGLDSIRLYWGILDDTEHRMDELSYEHPFGIGYLTMVARM